MYVDYTTAPVASALSSVNTAVAAAAAPQVPWPPPAHSTTPYHQLHSAPQFYSSPQTPGATPYPANQTTYYLGTAPTWPPSDSRASPDGFYVNLRENSDQQHRYQQQHLQQHQYPLTQQLHLQSQLPYHHHHHHHQQQCHYLQQHVQSPGGYASGPQASAPAVLQQLYPLLSSPSSAPSPHPQAPETQHISAEARWSALHAMRMPPPSPFPQQQQQRFAELQNSNTGGPAADGASARANDSPDPCSVRAPHLPPPMPEIGPNPHVRIGGPSVRRPPPPTLPTRARPERYKTTFCRHFDRESSCLVGTLCRFAHGDEDLRTVDQNVEDGLTTETALEEYVRRLQLDPPCSAAAEEGTQQPKDMPKPQTAPPILEPKKASHNATAE